MATIWVISDTHFGHANFLTFRREDGSLVRPFSSVEEMDDLMIQNWNKRVKAPDHVYHLGDVAMRQQHLAVTKCLNGKLRLVRGNHDIFKTKTYLKAGFEEIHGCRVLADVCLTHIPIHPDSLKFRWHGNLHGHIHERTLADPRYLNLSVEQPYMNYGPITIEEAIERLKQQQEGLKHGSTDN